MKLIFKVFLLFIAISLFSQESSKKKIGISAGKANIELYRFGSGNQVIVLIGGIYGDQKNTGQIINNFITKIVENKGINLSGKQIWIIPQLNPDAIANKTRVNNNNVDIYRNFATENRKSYYFRYSKIINTGNTPLSQPESQIVKQIFDEIEHKKYKAICLIIQSGHKMVKPGDFSRFNLRLFDIISDRKKKSFHNLQACKTGSLPKWLAENYQIAAVETYFQEQKDSVNNKLDLMIKQLLPININKKIYAQSLMDIFQSVSTDSNSYLINSLPDKVKQAVIISKDKEEFEHLYQQLQSDVELLLLVNKKHYLDADYIPEDMFQVKEYFKTNKQNAQLRTVILDDLKELFADSKKNGIELTIISAYRSFDVQKIVYNKWKKILGEKEAKMVSAYPGASQHQLGTTIDFNMLNEKFAETKEGKWLSKNAYKYGFILSYPAGLEEITGYNYEPWHYRYIGKSAALLVYKYFHNNLELFLNWYWNNRLD